MGDTQTLVSPQEGPSFSASWQPCGHSSRWSSQHSFHPPFISSIPPNQAVSRSTSISSGRKPRTRTRTFSLCPQRLKSFLCQLSWVPSAPETSTVGHNKGSQEAHIGLASGTDPEKGPPSVPLRQEGTNARASPPWAILNARPLCISTQPWNPAGHQESEAPTPALPSLVCDADQDLGPSVLFQVAELENLQGPELPDLCDFRFPWDLVCLSAEAESGTSSHPILLVRGGVSRQRG